MKKLLKAAGAVLLCILVVVVVRAILFVAEPVVVPPAPPLELDARAAAERLAEAIRFPTVTRAQAPHFDPSAFRELHAYLERTFPKVHKTLKREMVNEHSALYEWTGTDPALQPILLMAHLDVVPVEAESRSAWTHDPFGGVIAEDMVWGRGTLDDKGSAVGILEAAETLLGEGFVPKRTILVAFGHDEEIGGARGAKAIAAILEQRGVQLELVLDEGGVISEGIVPGVKEPIALIGVAEKGYTTLLLTVEADGGHSSMPPPQTAIGILSRAITRLEDNPMPAHLERSAEFFDYVGPKMPFHFKLIFANLWLFKPVVAVILGGSPPMNAGMRTTTAPTIFRAGVKENVLPSRAEAVVNFRIIPGETVAGVQAKAREIIADERVKIATYAEAATSTSSTFAATQFSSEPSGISDVRSSAYALIETSIRQALTEEEIVVAPYLVVGATDSRYFTGRSKNVFRFLFNRLGKEDIKRFHGTNERISIENYVQAVKFYHRLITGAQAL